MRNLSSLEYDSLLAFLSGICFAFLPIYKGNSNAETATKNFHENDNVQISLLISAIIKYIVI